MKLLRYFCVPTVLLSLVGVSAFAADATDTSQTESTGQFGPAINTFASPGGGGGGAAAGGGGFASGLPHFGVGVDVSILLGIGVEAATSITQKSNVRGAVHFFGYDYSGTGSFLGSGSDSGFNYDLNMHLRSAQITYDWFPFGGGFHLSPGVMIYNGNKITGSLTVPANKKITLNNVDYTSNPANPASGTAEIDFNSHSVAPMFLFGWGNLLKRKGGHFSAKFELGAAFVGDPKFKLGLVGSVCTTTTPITCVNPATDPGVQANIQAQQSKGNSDLKGLSIYPVISTGVGWRF